MAKLVATFLLFFLLFAPLVVASRGIPTSAFKKLIPKIKKALTSNRSWSVGESSGITYQNRGPVGLQAQLRWSSDNVYVLELGVGNPARNVSLIVDTSDNFIWNDCLQSSLQSTVQPYYPGSSNTFRTTPCDSQDWEDTLDFFACSSLPQCKYNCSWAEGVLANETFRFGGSSPPLTLSFGCNDVKAFNNSNSTGYAGVGSGPLSLISQLSFSKFSYCFTDFYNDSISSYMFFGSFADLDDNVTDVNTTLLIQENSSYYYYLDLEGISVDSKRLSIPPATLQYVANSSGTIIYTSDPLTYLVRDAYIILKEEVESLIGLPLYKQSNNVFGLDLCFNWTSDVPLNVSSMTFHFAGANMTSPLGNFFVLLDDGKGMTVLCLTILPINDTYSYMGSFLQQNLQFVYDLQNKKLTFRSTKCDQLPPHKSGGIQFDLHSPTFFIFFLLYLLLL